MGQDNMTECGWCDGVHGGSSGGGACGGRVEAVWIHHRVTEWSSGGGRRG